METIQLNIEQFQDNVESFLNKLFFGVYCDKIMILATILCVVCLRELVLFLC